MDGCIPMEALGTLDTLGADDPARRHLERCARCSAMLVAYREFVRAEAPARASVHDADARLAAFIAQHVDARAVEGSGASRRPRGRWFEMPSFRFAAAAVVVLVAAIAITRWLPSSNETVLRGDPRVVLTLEAPRVLSDGSLELEWMSVPDADAYQIVLLRDDLSEVVRIPAGGEHRMIIERAAVPADATHWQVAALREGAVVTESTPELLAP